MTTDQTSPTAAARAFKTTVCEIAQDLYRAGGLTIEQATAQAARLLVDKMVAERPALLALVHTGLGA